MTEDILWKQRFDNYNRALHQLTLAVELSRQRPLTLVGDGLDYRLLGEIAGRLEESPIPYQVDLSILEQIDNPRLREHIERVGVVFYPVAPSTVRQACPEHSRRAHDFGPTDGEVLS